MGSFCVGLISQHSDNSWLKQAEERETLLWLMVSEVSVYHSRDDIAEYLSGSGNVWPRFVRMDQEAGVIMCGWSLSLVSPGCWRLSQRTERKGSWTQGGFAQCITAVQRKECQN